MKAKPDSSRPQMRMWVLPGRVASWSAPRKTFTAGSGSRGALAPSRRWTILNDVPDNTVRYRDWKVVRLYRWQENLTLMQYAVLATAAYLVACAAVLAIAWWLVPHSWLPHPVALLPALVVAVAVTQAMQ